MPLVKSLSTNSLAHHAKNNLGYTSEVEKLYFYSDYKRPEIAGNEARLDYPSRFRYKMASFAVDWGLLAIPGILSLLAFNAPNRRYWFALDDPSISYPSVDPILTTEAAFATSVVVPFAILLIIGIALRNNEDLHHALLGMAQALAWSFMVTSLGWYLVGGLRPDFLSRCKPDLDLISNVTVGHRIPGVSTVYFQDDICTGNKDHIKAGQQGHAATAFASMVFLALYINAKLKTSDKFAHSWKVMIVMIPPLFAAWIAVTRVVDHHHTYFQIFWGGLIGVVFAFFAYGLQYNSVLGADNHVPVGNVWHMIGRETELPQI